MKTKETLFRLLKVLSPFKWVMAISIAARVLNFLSGSALLVLGVYAVAMLISGKPLPFAVVFGLLIAFSLLKGLFRYVEQYTGHYVAFHLLARLRYLFYTAIEPQAPALLLRMRSGDLVSRVSADVDRIEPFYAHTIAPFSAALIAPTLLLVGLFFIHPLFVPTLLPFLLLVGVAVPWWVNRVNRQASVRARVAAGEVNAFLTDSLQGLRDILAFNYGLRRKKMLRMAGERLLKAQSSLGKISALQNGIIEGLITAGILSLLVVGFSLLQQSSLSIPELAAAVALEWMSFQPLLGVTAVINDFNVAMTSAARLFDLMDLPPVVQDPVEKQVFPSGALTITFQNVSFAYPTALDALPEADISKSKFDKFDRQNEHSQKALSDVSFEIPYGRTVALVGESGSGKSTLIALLVRFWDPQQGVISINGIDIKRFGLKDLRDHIAVVSQQTYIFNATIRQNIALARPEASDEEIIHAAKQAHLHDFIMSLPDGYDTQVGEMGSRLSGGQRQRIALARAFLKNAPILVLDEATANLDPETEQDIQAIVRLEMSKCTKIIVAHRLSTVRDADEILVFQAGRLVERGNHQTLIAKAGVYSALFESQQDLLNESRSRNNVFVQEA